MEGGGGYKNVLGKVDANCTFSSAVGYCLPFAPFKLLGSGVSL